MKITGLDGKEHSLKLKRRWIIDSKCSKLHLRARILLTKEFPYDIIYEELTLPGTKNERQARPLFADFFIPQRLLMIEVQGEQHYKYNSHFFDNKMEFYKAQSRDRQKLEWCKLNDFILLQLPFNETDEQWLQKIRDRI